MAFRCLSCNTICQGLQNSHWFLIWPLHLTKISVPGTISFLGTGGSRWGPNLLNEVGKEAIRSVIHWLLPLFYKLMILVSLLALMQRYRVLPIVLLVVSILVCSGGFTFYKWSLIGAKNRLDYDWLLDHLIRCYAFSQWFLEWKYLLATPVVQHHSCSYELIWIQQSAYQPFAWMEMICHKIYQAKLIFFPVNEKS